MTGKRKGRAHALEAPNLKRFRDDVADLVFEGAMKSGGGGGAVVSTGGGGAHSKTTGKNKVVNRKERRRQLKKDKKQRIRNFQLKKRGEEIPVLSSSGKKIVAKKKEVAMKEEEEEEEPDENPGQKTKKKKKKKNKKKKTESEESKADEVDETEEWRRRAKEVRVQQLLRANEEEDKMIRSLEKNLGIKKRKKKKKTGETGGSSSAGERSETTTASKMPNSFKLDGLDFLLELCEETTAESAAQAEKSLEESERRKKKKLVASKDRGNDERGEEVDEDDAGGEEDRTGEFGDESSSPSDGSVSDGGNSDDENDFDDNEEEDAVRHDDDEEGEEEEEEEDLAVADSDCEENESGKAKHDDEDEEEEGEPERGEVRYRVDSVQDTPAETFEDIYGRVRDVKTRKIVKDNRGVAEPGEGRSKDETSGVSAKPEVGTSTSEVKAQSKYVPPSLRAAMQKTQAGLTPDGEKRQKVSRQMKGLLNRLSEVNVSSIASGIEEIYASAPRNIATSSFTELVLGACVPPRQATAPRFLLEHSLLVGVLHQTVGAEVGAHLLQECVKVFDEFIKSAAVEEGDKRPDNVVGLLCGLFLFKVVHCSLLFDVVKSLTRRFADKDVEMILILFRNIGFFLRKEDPMELKGCLTDLQRRAAECKSAAEADASGATSAGLSKVQFMLDVLLAVKNNNMTKIPNYDAETPERMVKVLRSTLSAKKSSQGENSLRVSLEELLNADVKGKWWIVGSAWEGRQVGAASSTSKADSSSTAVSVAANDATLAKIETLAAKQRMNTQLRKTIFAILLTAEDYVDCFQRLLKLNLNEKQEREIVYVLGSACLHEKVFNPYYAHLAGKLGGHDERFQVTFKYWFWDKYRELESMRERRVGNLARLVAHLVVVGRMSLAAFKIVEFYKMGEENKNLSAFLTTTMTIVLTDEDEKRVLSPFLEISKSPKLAVLRQSLLLFLRHFLARGDEGESGESSDRLLRERIEKVAEFLKKK